MFEPTTASAIEYANQNRLEEWIHMFLCGEGDNKAFSDGLKLMERRYTAPQKMSLDRFGRCCGPEPDMKWQIPEEPFWRHVSELAERYKTGAWDMPPLIVEELDGTFVLNDGNHRYEALRSLGIHEYWVIVWKTV